MPFILSILFIIFYGMIGLVVLVPVAWIIYAAIKIFYMAIFNKDDIL